MIPTLMVVEALARATVFLLSIWTITVHSKESALIRETEMGLARIVNHAYCDSSLSDEDKVTKKSLKEIHTYAELKFDPRGNLPDSFTICSSLMTPSCPSYFWPSFFTILDNDKAQFFAPVKGHKEMTSFLRIYFQATSKSVVGKIPPIFPNQWIKDCLSINTTSGFITWVVEGVHIMNTTSDEVTNSTSRPKDLSKKLVLGAKSFGVFWVPQVLQLS